MARKFAVSIDLQKNELQNARIQNLAGVPGSPVSGQAYYDTTNNATYIYNGVSWRPADAAKLTDGSIQISALATNPLSRANHTGTQLAATISDFDTQVRTSRLDQMAAPTAAVSFNTQRLTNVAAATTDTDGAQWGQVKSLVNGLDWKGSVVVAVSTNVNTASPGASLDGVALSSGDRVLLYGQSTASQNGLWVWNGAAAAMTRPTDWVSATATGGATVPIEQGTSADKLGICTTNGAITVDTTSTSWTIMAAGSTYIAGAGLTESPAGTFNVGAGTGISVAADSVSIDTSVVVRKYAADVGDGSSTAITLTHNFGTKDIVVEVFTNASPWDTVEVDVTRPTANTVTLTFASAPAAAAYRAIVTG